MQTDVAGTLQDFVTLTAFVGTENATSLALVAELSDLKRENGTVADKLGRMAQNITALDEYSVNDISPILEDRAAFEEFDERVK